VSATSEAPVAAAGLPGWIPQLARAIAALALGVLITLTLDHSAGFALIVFGVFAVLSGAILLAGTLRGGYAGGHRTLFVIQGAVAVGAGIAALVATTAGVPYLVGVVAGFGLATGALELASGIRARRRHPAARDWVLVGAATLALAVIFLLVPTDLAQPFAGDRGISGTLTSAVVLTGVLGAWAVIVGVVQAISAVSLRGEIASQRSSGAMAESS
jgi:uncharacterized membrane protein HdeD (DUF308 family)